MKKTIKFELKRGLQSTKFWISEVLLLCISLMDFWVYRKNYRDNYYFSTVAQSWIGTDGVFMFNSLYYLLVTVIGLFPVGGSYYQDLKSGYIRNVCVKVARKSYYTAKIVVNFILVFFLVTIPLIVNLFISMYFYPLRLPEKLWFLGGTGDGYLFSDLYYSSTWLYASCFIIICGFLCGILSWMCMCISGVAESSFITTVTPFAVCIISAGGVFGYGSQKYSYLNIINGRQIFPASEKVFAVVLSMTFFLVFGWLMVSIHKKDYYE